LDLRHVAILASVMPREHRRDQVLEVLRQSQTALDDGQIAQAPPMNPIYVNTICRQLAADGLIVPGQGRAH